MMQHELNRIPATQKGNWIPSSFSGAKVDGQLLAFTTLDPVEVNGMAASLKVGVMKSGDSHSFKISVGVNRLNPSKVPGVMDPVRSSTLKLECPANICYEELVKLATKNAVQILQNRESE